MYIQIIQLPYCISKLNNIPQKNYSQNNQNSHQHCVIKALFKQTKIRGQAVNIEVM